MSELTPQETAVLEQVARNPFIGQQEIADALGIARSTVAAHVVQLVKNGYILGRGYILPRPGHLVCIGGAVFDRKHLLLIPLQMETSNPVESFHSFGGVARNVAENLAMLGVNPTFISVVGNDQTGEHLLAHLRDRGVDTSRVIVAPGRTTAEYSAILSPDGDLVTGVANMAIFDLLTPEALAGSWSHLAGAAWVLTDTNPPAETLSSLIRRQGGGRYRLAVEAVSAQRATKLPPSLAGIDLLCINVEEGAAYLECARPTTLDDALDMACVLQDRGAAQVQVSMAPLGLTIASAEGPEIIPAFPTNVVDITGAGDSAVAGTLYGLLAGKNLSEAAHIGCMMGTLTIESRGTVRTDLTRELLDASLAERLRPPAPTTP